ncbi:monovalent cation/H+ antiporter subunit F [Gracilibacillus halophilus YIM-C55.5]|uniref:Monovalent cation/H+ antiporter subunit F n=1 Tax=Gracilibacillus halophilus YIM-C55.5 TaxID=1308866 RepID=N4WTF0_9BACI|nr:Na(+)/H(+) antiporter subunit F1 [Gracilibacillus halophilus]ENH97600.1 monovalent cation/H+ antiporter subunit F [Gracilibacillus halophilus YIM-C55.5]
MNQLDGIIDIVAAICMVTITISIALLLYRVVKGPTNPDRAVALDAIGLNLMAIAGLVAILLGTTRLNDVILLIGILLFIGTIALAKYLEKGVIIDREHD